MYSHSVQIITLIHYTLVTARSLDFPSLDFFVDAAFFD